MNSKLAILFFTVLVSISLQGQVKYDFGAGLNYNNYYFKNIDNGTTTSRSGLYASFTPKYQINKKLSAGLELRFSSEGYLFSDQNLEFKFNYIRLIPQLEYRVFKKLGLIFGPNIGYRINEKYRGDDLHWHSNPVNSLKDWDFGLTAGIKLYVRNFYFTVRYNYGFNNVSNFPFTDSQGNNIENARQLNRNIQFGVGLVF